MTLWKRQFEEEVTRLWLRWCDHTGQFVPTGAERADESERRSRKLAERLQAMGVNSDTRQARRSH